MRIIDYPGTSRDLDGSEPVAAWQDGQQVAVSALAVAALAPGTVKPLYGVGPPAAYLGVLGSIYFDQTDLLNPVLYGPRKSTGWGPGVSLRGPSGAATAYRINLAALKAAPVLDGVSFYDGSQWQWDTSRDFTGLADDANIVGSGDAALSAGAWVRKRSRKVLSIRDLGVVGGLPDETAAVQAAINAAIAQAPCVLDFVGLDIRTAVQIYDGASDVVFEGSGATIRPVDGQQPACAFKGASFGRVIFRNFAFVQTAGYHYEATIKADVGNVFEQYDNTFTGVGFGVRVQQVKQVRSERNAYRQVGIYPRPSPFDPSGNGFNAAYERYGCGFRAILCDSVYIDDDFENELPVSGNTADVTGGAGAFSVDQCNDVTFCGKAINAPGQGFGAAGQWQNTDVVGALLNGTYDSTLRGQRITFDHVVASGCNQEGATAYGCRSVKVISPNCVANRNAGVELWQSVDCEIIGGICEQPTSAASPIQAGGFGAAGGNGSVHVVGCWNVTAQGVKIPSASRNGYRVDGSYHVSIDGGRVDNYGSDNLQVYISSGVSVGVFVDTANSVSRNSDFVRVSGVQFYRAAANTSGSDLFAQADTQTIYSYGCWSQARPVTYAGGVAAFKGLPVPFVAGGVGLSHGGSIGSPNATEGSARTTSVGITATTIYTFSPLSPALGHDSAFVIVNGADDGEKPL